MRKYAGLNLFRKNATVVVVAVCVCAASGCGGGGREWEPDLERVREVHQDLVNAARVGSAEGIWNLLSSDSREYYCAVADHMGLDSGREAFEKLLEEGRLGWDRIVLGEVVDVYATEGGVIVKVTADGREHEVLYTDEIEALCGLSVPSISPAVTSLPDGSVE